MIKKLVLINYNRLLLVSIALFAVLCHTTTAENLPESYSLEELKQLDDGILEKKKSPYSRIRVSKNDNIITLYFEKKELLYTESRIDLENPYTLQIAYAKFMAAGLMYPGNVDRVLMLGYGGGSVTEYFRHYHKNLDVDGVEIDPVVIEMAKRYFLVKPDQNNRIHIQDAREFVNQTKKKYDLVFTDAFGGGFVPKHLVTIEFFKEIKSILSDDGCIVTNLYDDSLHKRFLAAYEKLFQVVDVYPTGVNTSRITVACKGKKRSVVDLRKRALQLDKKYKYIYPLTDILKYRTEVEVDSSIAPYRD